MPLSESLKLILDKFVHFINAISFYLDTPIEAGQYSCIFVYLKLKMNFSSLDVSIFIAVVGILSILAQVILGDLMR